MLSSTNLDLFFLFFSHTINTNPHTTDPTLQPDDAGTHNICQARLKQGNTNLLKQVLERLRRDKLVYALIIFHNSLFYKQRQGRIRHRSDDRLHTFGNNFTSKNKTPWTVSAASRWTARQFAAFLSTYRSRCPGRCPYNLSLDLSFGRRDETSPIRSAPRGSLICR